MTVIPVEEKKAKRLEITIADTQSKFDSNQNVLKEPIAKLNITVGEKTFKDCAINLDQKKEQTIILDVSSVNQKINTIKFEKSSPNYDIKYIVKSIKAIYK